MKILPLSEPYWHSFLTMADHTLIVCLNKPSLKEKKNGTAPCSSVSITWTHPAIQFPILCSLQKSLGILRLHGKVFTIAKSGQNANVHQRENLKVFHIRQYYATAKKKTKKSHLQTSPWLNNQGEAKTLQAYEFLSLLRQNQSTVLKTIMAEER